MGMSGVVRAVALTLAAAVAVACGGAGTASRTPDPLAGRYSLSGGGGATEIVNALRDAFAKQHPSVTFVTEDIGSDAGVALTASGSVDLGMTSRDLKEAEKGKVQSIPVGVSGTAVAVNSVNPVTGLSKDQVKGIYAGTITDWSAVGGQPGKLTVLIRESTAATRSAFESFFFEGKPTYGPGVIEVYEIDETIKSLQSFKDSIGMVTINARTLAEPSIRMLAIDGVAPTRMNLQNGSYKIRRPLFLVYNNTSVKPAVQAFLDFVRGPEGQRIIASY